MPNHIDRLSAIDAKRIQDTELQDVKEDPAAESTHDAENHQFQSMLDSTNPNEAP